MTDAVGRKLYPTEAELDAQFMLNSIPDLTATRERRDSEGAKALAEFEALRDIVYGNDPDEKLIFFPAQSLGCACPLQIFIHGGFWSSMGSTQFTYVARGFVPAGIAVALVDYSPIPRVSLASLIESCRRAVNWCHAKAVQAWITAEGAKTAYIAPGSPWENGYVESFNARLRDKRFDGEIFYSLREAQIIIESWRIHDNPKRPHASMGYRPPAPEVFVPAIAAWPHKPAPIAHTAQESTTF